MLRHVSEVVVPTRGAPFDEVQYCGEQAGFLRREHEACRERDRSALAEVSDAVRVAAVEGRGWGDIEGDVGKRIEDGLVGRERLPELVMDGVDGAVTHVLNDDILNEEEEECIAGFVNSLENAGPALPGSGLNLLGPGSCPDIGVHLRVRACRAGNATVRRSTSPLPPRSSTSTPRARCRRSTRCGGT